MRDLIQNTSWHDWAIVLMAISFFILLANVIHLNGVVNKITKDLSERLPNSRIERRAIDRLRKNKK